MDVKKVFRHAIYAIGILSLSTSLLFSCDFFCILNDPSDPNSPNYQGYTVVDKVNDVIPMPPSGVLSFPPTLYASKLVGALGYRFQVSSDQSFANPEAESEQTSNIFVPSAWVPSKGAGTYYFRVQARKDANWGALSQGQAFILSSQGTMATPTVSIPAGSYTEAQTVSLNCSTQGALIRYSVDGTTPSATTGTLYSTPVQVSSSLTLKAVAYKQGWNPSSIISALYIITGAVPAPTFSLAAGTYSADQTVELECALEGSTIRYTTDGTSPSSTSGTIYSSAITISRTTTIKAIAFKSDWNDSQIAQATYTMVVPDPTFSPTEGTYTAAQNVTINCALPGISIRYTTDGTEPTSTAGTLYSGAFSVSSTKTIKALAYKSGWTSSQVASSSYTITGTVATPTYSVDAGTYTTAQSVTISCSLPGASIRFTTDGTNPTRTVGTLYSSAITVSSSTTLKAIAYKTDWLDSNIANATYIITGTISNPTFVPAAGTYTTPQSITILAIPADATIRYTLDGSVPTETVGTIYSGAFQVSSTKTVKAIAYKTGWTTSQVSSSMYTITGKVATPSFTPVEGVYTTRQSVTISCTLNGASIRYTSDGSTPTSSHGTLYSTPVTVSASQTLKAIAYKTDWVDSEVGSASYTITEIIPIEMVDVTGGTFQMGSVDGEPDEQPIHRVKLSSFYMSKYEITQELYMQICGVNPAKFSTEEDSATRPVEKVGWYDAINFCNLLSQRDGYESVYTYTGTSVKADFSKSGYRLPTEAEWEYAAKGGIEGSGYKYSGSNSFEKVAWCSENSLNSTHPVGNKMGNEIGLYDLSGNVKEWCWGLPTPYTADDQVDPRMDEIFGSTDRVRRGGSYNFSGTYSSVTYRDALDPNTKPSDVGFRVVRKSNTPISYSIGSIGPAGGYVFYDKGSYSDGWRYLEVASRDPNNDNSIEFGDTHTPLSNTSIEIGTGKSNTAVLVADNIFHPAKICDNLIWNGYSDWYLPSKNELELVYMNLKLKGIGDFANVTYWSSSEARTVGYYYTWAWALNFSDGVFGGNGEYYSYFYVRAIREF